MGRQKREKRRARRSLPGWDQPFCWRKAGRSEGPPARRSPGPLEEAEGRHVVRGFEQHRPGLVFVQDAEAVQLHGAAPRAARPRDRRAASSAAAAPRDRRLLTGRAPASFSGSGVHFRFRQGRGWRPKERFCARAGERSGRNHAARGGATGGRVRGRVRLSPPCWAVPSRFPGAGLSPPSRRLFLCPPGAALSSGAVLCPPSRGCPVSSGAVLSSRAAPLFFGLFFCLSC